MVSCGLTVVGTATAPIGTMLFWTQRCSEETTAGGKLNTADGVNHFTARIPTGLLFLICPLVCPAHTLKIKKKKLC